MAEYIGCRNCDSPDCHGCNMYTLSRMLNSGKFDGMMNGNRSINPFADVVEVKHGRWVEGRSLEKCSVCGKKGFPDWYYCPKCGARMDGE